MDILEKHKKEAELWQKAFVELSSNIDKYFPNYHREVSDEDWSKIGKYVSQAMQMQDRILHEY